MNEQPIRILMVDDDELASEAVSSYIRREYLPYRLHSATSKPEMVESLREHSFDVILLDYKLGGVPVPDLIPLAGDIPVIIVTGKGPEEDAVEAMKQGAWDYIIKDLSLDYLGLLPVTIRSVLERHRNKKELDHLRRLLGDIINSMPSILVGVDTEGRVTRWNREAENTTGIAGSKAQGRLLETVCPPLAGQMKKVEDAIRQCQPQKDELMVRHSEEEFHLWNVTVYPLTGNTSAGAVIRVDDVTERIRMEAMLIHSEKMLSMGGLAAGMAHELNNPLAGILHNIQVVRNRLTSNLPKNRRIAEECGLSIRSIEAYMEQRGILPLIGNIMNSGRKAANIVDSLLTFSHINNSRSEPHDLGRLLDKAVELAACDYELKNKFHFDSIAIQRDYHSPLPPVLCEPGKIQQVFFNLIKNGVQAMAEGNGDQTPRFLLRVAPDKSYVRVEIEDNGPGMDPETQKRAFEPFFTTRNVGEGAGLGLSVSYFIVTRDHKGLFMVNSAPGEGTRFTLRLPRDRRAA
ncbi:MAG: response regulator [bacterium]|nr:response regulator [bacterium]